MDSSRRTIGGPIARFFRAVLHGSWVILGAVGLTLAFFMVLPLLRAISNAGRVDTKILATDVASLDPPEPPRMEEEPEPEPEEEKEPPKLDESAPPLDLASLEIALNPGGGGWGGGDFMAQIAKLGGTSAERAAVISFDDFDQAPRLRKPIPPKMTTEMRRSAPGWVSVLLDIDTQGRVRHAVVERSSDPVFEQAALQAVKKWVFEPAKRSGAPVPSRNRQKIDFPKS